jgi:hypothetical protein
MTTPVSTSRPEAGVGMPVGGGSTASRPTELYPFAEMPSSSMQSVSSRRDVALHGWSSQLARAVGSNSNRFGPSSANRGGKDGPGDAEK